MTIRSISGLLATVLVSFSFISATIASPPDPAIPSDSASQPNQTPDPAESSPAAGGERPSISLLPVPPILRLHVPILGQQRGVLVDTVEPGSAPEKAGIRAGDVLIEAGGRSLIAGDSLPEMDADFPIIVVRRGRTRILRPEIPGFGFPRPGFSGPRFSAGPRPSAGSFDPFTNRPGIFDRRLGAMPNGALGSRASSSVSTAASGDQSVAVSRAGKEIALEMSIPGLPDGKIRLRGTEAEIEQQLQEGDWSDTVKAQVRAALRLNR